MSDPNIELVRAGIDAYNRGGVDWVIARLEPDFEVYAAPGLVNAGSYRGADGFAEWMRQWEEAWDDFRIEIERAESIDRTNVLLDVIQRGTGSGSGIEVEMRLYQLHEVEDGRWKRFHIYNSREDALAAAGDGRGGEIEAVAGAIEAWDRADLEGVLSRMATDVEFRPTGSIPGVAHLIRGHDEYRQFFQVWSNTWERFNIEITRIARAGDGVVLAATDQRAAGRSGIEVNRQVFFYARVGDGVIKYYAAFEDEHEALAAAGLDEWPGSG
jgi:ketosteroid isomerase-like protein